ncbi:hypothetical protein AMATHDRAFT_1081 [Amanita thiersii Skay4041]|uniref:Uncharacterized protein n=1 Tax=Amanita thiersii Skay4041 TaxID=703135 RepID=A0A2A9NTJ0_9AGAR|nr:hypothetical protein AMATHDRAFT_1081 [Amanita thiersii Skay4041]
MSPERTKTSRQHSKDLVPVGPRNLSKVSSPNEKAASAQRPTTERALILRNGKYGARGTGELVSLSKKLTGREKLDLLAEDLIKHALLAPFHLDHCINIASAQFDVYLDEITNLKDPELFYDIIQAELEAQSPSDLKIQSSPWDASHVASIVGTKIHNTYLLASGWKVVLHMLMELASNGLVDDNVKSKLKNDHQFKLRFLTLYDIVGELVSINQNRFSVLTKATAHYSRYFKKVENVDPSAPDIVFDLTELREACTSFLDSIVIELCFPRAPYPEYILFSILSDAVEEAPWEARRFPQEVWDVVGDFRTSVELHALLEAPLLAMNDVSWREHSREKPEIYEDWVDAQLHSHMASNLSGKYQDVVYPLDKTKEQTILDEMWQRINNNYKSVSGKNMDNLWRLSDEFNVSPQWSGFHKSDSADEAVGRRSKAANMRLTLFDDISDDSHGSMPSLQTVSGSSEESEFYESDSDLELEESSDQDSYNTDEEEELRTMLREAMDYAHATGFLNPAHGDPESKPPPQDEGRAGNPFLSLLGSLRGRMFSSNPKLKTADRDEPRELPLTIDGTQVEVIEKSVPGPTKEDEIKSEPMSRKKKKKKKKTTKAIKPLPQYEAVSVPQSVPDSELLHDDSKSSLKQPSPPPKSPRTSVGVTSEVKHPHPFTIPLPFGEPATAQSGHAYMKSQDVKKEKIKTRGIQAILFSRDTKQGKMSLEKPDKVTEEDQKDARRSWFSQLSKRALNWMHQLLRTSEDEKQGQASMKWDHFVQLMTGMGFTYEPKTAGSSVRFDPPDKRDKSITIHRPHPDSTIGRKGLMKISRRLKKYYGWNAEELMAQTSK